MGVYIKGMEMPLEKSRIIQIYPDGTVRRLDGSVFNSHFEAVPIPPHGRLIDADALMKDGWVLHKQVMRMGGYAIHELPLTNPSIAVIIPASGGQEDE